MINEHHSLDCITVSQLHTSLIKGLPEVVIFVLEPLFPHYWTQWQLFSVIKATKYSIFFTWKFQKFFYFMFMFPVQVHYVISQHLLTYSNIFFPFINVVASTFWSSCQISVIKNPDYPCCVWILNGDPFITRNPDNGDQFVRNTDMKASSSLGILIMEISGLVGILILESCLFLEILMQLT